LSPNNPVIDLEAESKFHDINFRVLTDIKMIIREEGAS